MLGWSEAVKLGVPTHDDEEDGQFDPDHAALHQRLTAIEEEHTHEDDERGHSG